MPLRHYTIKPLDTLQKISLKFYNTPDFAEYIWKANTHYIVNPNQLFPGQVITIPHLDAETALEHVYRKLLG